MAKSDRCTDEEAAIFSGKKEKILSFTSTWDFKSKKYLEAVLDGLELMTADYSYGNGEISIEDSPTWKTLNPEVIIPMINSVIKPNLNIKVSAIYNKFPTILWFEVEDLMNDLDEDK